MAKAMLQSVDDYIAAQPLAVQSPLTRVRNTIRKAVARAAESISYHMPTYKLDGQTLLYFAGWKQHYSLYPATAGVVAAFADQLSAYEVQKGTIRFPLTQSVPVKLIANIAKQRAKEIGEKAQRGDSRASKTSKRAGPRARKAAKLR